MNEKLNKKPADQIFLKQNLRRIFSGIQPTGSLHLGNYLGAIRNWIDLQDNHDCLFGVMNLHAITVAQNPKELEENVLLATAIYVACGLDPKKSTIFVQSEVSAHLELAWIFATLTPMGWLNRMTQFKDKTARNRHLSGIEGESIDGNSEDSIANLGLFSYPVLMASDILLYHADLVPVGEDQKQHLELTRDIAGAFNRRFGAEYFKLPEALIIKEVKRIMSLQDGMKKMSKSDPSEISRINLTDSAEEISKKIKKAKTDSNATISYDESRPEIYNLLNIFSAFSEKNPIKIAEEYQNSGFGKFKTDLAELLISKLDPISKKINELAKDKTYLQKVLSEGREKAQIIANESKAEIYKIVGLK